jgi:uncharacterized protein YgbK (DUF1537 family)
LHLELCCVAPAIPEFGRVTRNGVQYLNGRPIAESFYSRDPKQPVSESRVAEIVAREAGRPTGSLVLPSLRSHENQEYLARLIASGVQIVVADSETRGDLERVVDLFLKLPGQVFFVGGQGIGDALANFCVLRAGKENWGTVPGGAIVIVCGTLHPNARDQLMLFSRNHDMEPVFVDVDEFSDSAAIGAAAEKAAEGLIAQIKRRGLGFLASPPNPAQDPRLVEETLSSAVRKVHEEANLAGLILTGGTTAYEVCRRIGVKRLHLRQRISWGVVLAQAPDLGGMAIAVKGGSLGDVNAIEKVVDTVRSLV